MNTRYQEVETSFSELIHLLSKCFTPEEISEITDFLDHGEYGLALDTVVDIIMEENKGINHDILGVIVKISHLMELETDIFIKKITGHVC